MSFWWVNQNQTYVEEVGGEFMWSPKRQANGSRSQFYDNMVLVVPGDVVFSFRNTRLSAIGIVMGPAEEGAKPDFRSSADSWSQNGWVVPVFYSQFAQPIRPKDHMELIGPLLPEKYSPLQANGNGLQSVYLAAISEELGGLLLDLPGADLGAIRAAADPAGAEARDVQKVIDSHRDAPPTDVDRMVKARRGQGIFKQRVQQCETRCRLTGIATLVHLRASHIKPWSASTDVERLDGANGLLLAPHVDHLFDGGWISFADDGSLLVSRQLEPGLLASWGIDWPMDTGAFTAAQAAYLEYHRAFVFEKTAEKSRTGQIGHGGG